MVISKVFESMILPVLVILILLKLILNFQRMTTWYVRICCVARMASTCPIEWRVSICLLVVCAGMYVVRRLACARGGGVVYRQIAARSLYIQYRTYRRKSMSRVIRRDYVKVVCKRCNISSDGKVC